MTSQRSGMDSGSARWGVLNSVRRKLVEVVVTSRGDAEARARALTDCSGEQHRVHRLLTLNESTVALPASRRTSSR